MISDKKLTAAESNYLAWKSWGEEEFGLASRKERRYFDWLLSKSEAQSARNLLELGFGNGHFLRWAAERGMEVAGVEVQPELLARATAAGLKVWSSLDHVPEPSRLDLVVAFDVLEHIPQDQLPQVLAQLLARLTENGRLVFRVPNGESPFGRVHQHGDLTHCTTLGLSKFRQLAEPLGLVVEPLGDAPWYSQQHEPRNFRALVRFLLRWQLERLVAYAYGWDARAMGSNVTVVMRRRAAT